MPGVKRPGSKPFLDIREESAVTAPHTYPPPRPTQVPFDELKRRHEETVQQVEELGEEVQRISQLHAESDLERAEQEEKLEKARVRRAWNVVGLKIAGSIAAILAIVALYFGIWAKSALEPKVQDAKAIQISQVDRIDNIEKRVAASEAYNRLKYRRDLCIWSMVHSAFARGTGHDLTPLVDTGVHWTSESMPKLQLRVTWDTVPFFPITQCPEEPVPPGERSGP
jgi:hypothetical protein